MDAFTLAFWSKGPKFTAFSLSVTVELLPSIVHSSFQEAAGCPKLSASDNRTRVAVLEALCFIQNSLYLVQQSVSIFFSEMVAVLFHTDTETGCVCTWIGKELAVCVQTVEQLWNRHWQQHHSSFLRAWCSSPVSREVCRECSVQSKDAGSLMWIGTDTSVFLRRCNLHFCHFFCWLSWM